MTQNETKPELVLPTEPSTVGGSLFGEFLAAQQYRQPGETSLSDVFMRAAINVASTEAGPERAMYTSRFFDLMQSGKFCPGGRILAGAGTEHGNILNCFIQDAENMHTTSGAMDLVMKLALVSKVGGGNGTSLDTFRIQRPGQPNRAGRLFIVMDDAHPDADKFLIGETQDPAWPGNPVRSVRGYKAATVLTTLEPSDGDCVVARSSDPALVGLGYNHEFSKMHNFKTLYAEDSITSIMETAASMCYELLEGNDVVVDLGQIRSEGSPVSGSGGHASGPHSFAVEIFDSFAQWCKLGGPNSGAVAALRYLMAATLRVIVQGGTRRGAGMATIRVDHPEILNFLTAKDADRVQAEGDISTYNVSVKVTNEFMRLADDFDWLPITLEDESPAELVGVPGKYNIHDLISLGWVRTKSSGYGHQVSARWLLDEIATHAQLFAEPGLLFIDRINDNAKGPPGMSIQATNPCGEEPMFPGEACDLGALVVSAFVHRGMFKWREFDKAIRLAVRFLDNVLDINKFALKDNEEACLGFRRLGLGIMGLHDALILMNLEYGSEDGDDFVYRLGNFMATIAHSESLRLAKERGVPCHVAASGLNRRNIAVLTVAPTGTTSNLMGCTGGIEPLFALKYERRVGSDFVTVAEPIAVKLIGDLGHDPVKLLKTGLSTDLEQHPDREISRLAPLLRTANELPWQAHVSVQSALQRGFDSTGTSIANAISKTLNLPAGSTAKTVLDAYSAVFKGGCKGVTVYVDGSYENQVLSVGQQPDDMSDVQQAGLVHEVAAIDELFDADELEAHAKKLAFDESNARIEVAQTETLLTARDVAASFKFTRPKRLSGYTDQVALTDPTSGGKAKYLVTVNVDESGRPVEIILTSGKGGSRGHGEAEAIGRLASIALQQGVAPGKISATLRGIDSGMYGSYGSRLVNSPASLVAAVLEDAVRSYKAEQTPQLPVPEVQPASPPRAVSGPPCLACDGGVLIRREGCLNCNSCGFSKCG